MNDDDEQQTTEPEAPKVPDTGEQEAPADDGTPAEAPKIPADDGEQDPAEDADTFDRPYVENLRAEAASARVRVKDLEAKLHRLMVEQTGALADPADLEFDAAHLDDPEALQAAIDALLAARPHLKARRFEPGAAAQGPRSTASGSVDLAGLMRSAVT